MKNRCISLALLLLFCNIAAKAQWVPIPQPFANYIKTQISASAINGSQLDTTNAAIIALTYLSLQDYSFSQVADFTGIQYFDGLTSLTIRNSTATFIPPLPQGITELSLEFDEVSVYNNLPPGLTGLYISLASASFNVASNVSIPSFPSTITILNIFGYISPNPLPAFPPNLTELYLQRYGNTALPFLPNSVRYLMFANSGIRAIPNIPNSLERLDVSHCADMTYLQSTANSNLHTLFASSSGLTDIGLFPPSISSVNLAFCPLTSLSYLPDNLDELVLFGSSITYVPSTPISLNSLWLNRCSEVNIQDFLDKVNFQSGGTCFLNENGLTAVPKFKTGLVLNELYLSGNNFNTINLDSIPKVTSYLHIDTCNLIELEGSSINAEYVHLENNNLACIPLLGNRVKELFVAGNDISCLPNIPPPAQGFVCDMPLPACQTGCALYPVVKGNVFSDVDQNGINDSGEVGLAQILVKLNGLNSIVKTDSLGNFQFRCYPGQAYDLEVFPYSPYSVITTPAIALHIAPMVSGVVDSLRNIGIYTPSVNDIQIKITPLDFPRPGLKVNYRISVSNPGSIPQTGVAGFKFDPLLTFQSASASGIYAGDSVAWIFSNLLSGQTVQFNAIFSIPTSMPLGATLCSRAIANGNTPDTIIYNNRDSICQTVIGPYDPNDKTAYPGEILTKEEMLSGEGIDYVVRFQNTGTASAINVRVEDTISPLMEAATIRMIASSHVNEWRIDSGNVLKVFFDNINLPDSGANELLSHGFFRYSIKPKAGTAIGDSIKNTALIYFDFNAPIVTNTVKTDVTTLFAIPIAPQTVCEGQPLNLNFTDNPAISKIEWLRNDTALGIYGASLNIPNATLAHNGQYSVRITLNNDAVFSSAKSMVSVNPSFIPSVSIAQTTQNACSGSLVSFAANPNNGGTLPVYQWLINGALNFSGGDVLSVTLNRNDEVKAVMNSSLSCVTTPNDTSNLLLAVMDTLSTTSITIVAPTGICEGQSAAIATVANNAGNAAVYQWSINGQVVQNANTAALTTTLQNSDVVGVKLISSLQCVTEDTVSATQNITTTAAVVPTIALSASADNNICNGSSQSFKVSTTNQGQTPVYTWYLNGTPVSGLTSDSVQLSNLTDGDIIQAVLQSSATCATPAQVSSLTDTVEVIPAPDKPTITQSGSTLTADALDGIQWLLNGTPVQGANSASYTAEVNGVYSVLVTDNNGCTALSDTIGMRILSLGSIDISQAISVYPNPFSSQVTLQLDADLSADSWSFKLLNVSGQTILQAGVSQSITTLNMEQVASGVYMLHVQGSNGNKAFRLVKY